MHKYADDTYLVLPGSNFLSRESEVTNVELWAKENNLHLNRVKSAEIVFVSAWCRRDLVVPPSAHGFERVEQIKALGVTFTRKLSVSPHIEELLEACAKTLFALRTLRHHGLPIGAVQDIFQATVVAKLTYASPAWHGYANAADCARLEAFLRRSARLGFRSVSAPTFFSVCAEADDRLFSNIIRDPRHLLQSLLPPTRNEHYNLRRRAHNRQLPARTSSLSDNRFLTRMLYKNSGCSSNV